MLPGVPAAPKRADAAACGAPSISLNPPSVGGLSVSVNGGTSPGSGCSITSISWTWGDGTTSTSFFPATHVYTKAGTYTIVATTHQSDGQSASTSESVTLQKPTYIDMTGETSCPANANYATSYPFSEDYSPYAATQPSGASSSLATPASGPTGMSIGVYGGSGMVQVTQGDNLLYNETLSGLPLDYTVISLTIPGDSYGCIDFQSNGDPVGVSISNSGRTAVFMAYNLYDAPITSETAMLIMYPPQYAVNIVPSTIPVNTGISFLLVVPKGPLAAPLALWVGEGAGSWWAQLGIGRTWSYNSNASYFPGLGVFFPNGTFTGGSQNSNPIPLVAGDTYNFTMAVESGTTWESLLNGSVTGSVNLPTSYANEAADLGLETLPARGGDVNITNPIAIPLAMEFRVGGHWVKPAGLELSTVGENWQNGETTNAQGIGFWSVQGSLQNSSIGPDSLLFTNFGPSILNLPLPPGIGEPFYGTLPILRTGTYGPTVVKASASESEVEITSDRTAYVSTVFFDSTGTAMKILPAIVNGTVEFSVPPGAVAVEVYATTDYSSTYQGFYQVLSAPSQTTTTTTMSSSSPSTLSTVGTTSSSTLSTIGTPSSTTLSTVTIISSPTLASITTASRTSTSTSQTTTSGGIPEFPYQSLVIIALTCLVVVSYLAVRQRRPNPSPRSR